MLNCTFKMQKIFEDGHDEVAILSIGYADGLWMP